MDSLVDRLSPLRGQRVLVTGMSGFKGSWLSLWLDVLGANVTGMSLPPTTTPSLFVDAEIGSPGKHHIVDIRDRTSVLDAMRMFRPTVVFHLAAQPLVLRSYLDPLETFDTNVTGSLNVLEAVRQTDSVQSLVYVTSDKCYSNDESGRPYRETDPLGGRDPYSASKAAAELLFSSYWESFLSDNSKLGAVSARSGNVIGGGDWADDRLVPDAIRSLVRGESITLRHPTAVRPWQHVLDPLKGYLMLAADLLRDSRLHQGPWNFGPNPDSFRTVQQVADKIVDVWGDGASRIELGHSGDHEAGLLLLDSTKARDQLGWIPSLSFDVAVEWTVHWYRSHNVRRQVRETCRRQILDYMEAEND